MKSDRHGIWSALVIVLTIVLQCPCLGEDKRAIEPVDPASFKAPVLPAFPGAVGFGAKTTGGRGGRVIKVTNLKTTGPGSFAEALGAKGPRIIVFDVSGVVPKGTGRKDAYPCTDGNFTIAGQTAPGPGIALEGLLTIRGADNVLIRHIRDRFAGKDGVDSIGFSHCNNVMIDHVSVSWGADESLTLAHTKNATVQYTTIEESRLCWEGGDEAHNFGMIIGGGPSSLNHILFAHHHERTPVPQFGIYLDYRNSVIYNCKTGLHKPPPGGGNFVGNYLKHGPGGLFSPRIYHPIGGMAAPDINLKKTTRPVFAGGNYLTHESGYYEPGTGLSAGEPQRIPPAKTYVAEEAYKRVMATGGALPRDEITARCIYEVRTGTGLWNEQFPHGDWRSRMKGGAAPADSDGDGMPDSWEQAHMLNSRDPKDANKTVPEGASMGDRHKGYTYIEYYINELADTLEAEALVADRLRTSDGTEAAKPEWKDLPASIDELVSDIVKQTNTSVAEKMKTDKYGYARTKDTWKAIKALKDAGPKAAPAAEKLARAMDTSDSRQALFTAWALGMIAPFADEDKAVPVLIKALERTDYKRETVGWRMKPEGMIAWALGRFGSRAKPAVPVLAKTLSGRDGWAVQSAAWALRQMGPDAEPALDALIRAMGSKWAGTSTDNAAGYHAAHAIANVGKPAVATIISAFKNREFRKNPNLRRAGSVALGLIGTQAVEAVPALLDLLKSTFPALARGEAALALSRIQPGSAEVIRALGAAYNDRNYNLRNNVVKALGTCAVRNPAAVPYLEKALKDEKREVLYSALTALGRGGKQAAAVLTACLGSDDAWTRKYAARALGNVTAVDEKIISSLGAMLTDADPDVRFESVIALARHPNRAGNSMSALNNALADSDYRVRHAAKGALDLIKRSK